MNPDLNLSYYDYELPPDCIAQNPVVPRDSARLLVVKRDRHQHRIFRELPDLLEPGDLLIANDTRVIPARLLGRKPSGASVEVLLLEERQPNRWFCLVRPGKRLQVGATVLFEAEGVTVKAEILTADEATGGRTVEFLPPEGTNLWQWLDRLGQIPFPPYVTDSQADPDQYQTVYARQPGAVAAPTAGLHFTEELFDRLRSRGVERAFVTLHVGLGTFRPVEVDDITQHRMHEERIDVPAATVEKILQTKAAGKRVIAIGTTVVRSLEGAAQAHGGELKPYYGRTDLFIYPGYTLRVVDGLITNFHLPRSSLLMLVSAFMGRERLLALYREAIAAGYRFYSFGDAMLVQPYSSSSSSSSSSGG